MSVRWRSGSSPRQGMGSHPQAVPGEVQAGRQGEFLHGKWCQTLDQREILNIGTAQGGGGFPIPGGVQGRGSQ